jgi:hypothetical protein
MTKIQFSNGAVVDFNGTPTEKDIEEIAKKLQSGSPAGVKTQEPQKSQSQEKPSLLKRASSFIKKDVFGGGVTIDTNLAGDIFRSTLGSRGLAGVAQLPGKVIGQAGTIKEQTELSESLGGLSDLTNKLIKNLDKVTDDDAKNKMLAIINSNLETLGAGKEQQDITQKNILSPKDTISTSANAALTALSGSGSVAKGIAMKGAKALPVGSGLASNIYKASTVGKSVIPRALEMGAISAGFSASENIRKGENALNNTGLSFGVGMAFPFAGTATSKVVQSLPGQKLKMAEKVVNSLIKPLLKDFSYGKNPGRGVATEGIVFNSLEEGAVKIGDRLKLIGSQMDKIANSKKGEIIDISDVLSPIDKAIAEAQKTPRTNSALISRLQDAKDDLMGVVRDETGEVVFQKDLSNMTFQEVLDFKRTVGDITKFTGNASDDKLANTALKSVYGGAKTAVNKAAPEMAGLNERWANLKSAEIAIKYRDKIEARQNLISLAPKLLGGGLGSFGIVTMNPAAIGAALLSYGADTLFSSSAFKTRLAKWLAKSSKEERDELIRNAPVIKNILDKIFGKDTDKTSEKEILEALSKIKPGLSIEDITKKPGFTGAGDDLSSQIKKAKAEGKSFDEWVKVQEQKTIDKDGFTRVGDYVELYHGTSARRANKIADEGFRIRAVKNQTMSGDSESSRNYIWFAKKLDTAKSYAEHHQNPKTITVRIPKDVFERLDNKGLNSGPVSFWSKEEIPPKYIYTPEQTKSQLKQLWDKN